MCVLDTIKEIPKYTFIKGISLDGLQFLANRWMWCIIWKKLICGAHEHTIVTTTPTTTIVLATIDLNIESCESVCAEIIRDLLLTAAGHTTNFVVGGCFHAHTRIHIRNIIENSMMIVTHLTWP